MIDKVWISDIFCLFSLLTHWRRTTEERLTEKIFTVNFSTKILFPIFFYLLVDVIKSWVDGKEERRNQMKETSSSSSVNDKIQLIVRFFFSLFWNWNFLIFLLLLTHKSGVLKSVKIFSPSQISLFFQFQYQKEVGSERKLSLL